MGSQTKHLPFPRTGFAQKFDIDIGSLVEMSPTQGRFPVPPARLPDPLGQRKPDKVFNVSSVEVLSFLFLSPS